MGFVPDGVGNGPSDPLDTDDVDDGDTLALLVVNPRGKHDEAALDDAAAANAAFEITADNGFVEPPGPWPEFPVLCWTAALASPAPKEREYVSRRDTSDGILPLPPAAARCWAAGPYKLR